MESGVQKEILQQAIFSWKVLPLAAVPGGYQALHCKRVKSKNSQGRSKKKFFG
jgi:hypothetical protein